MFVFVLSLIVRARPKTDITFCILCVRAGLDTPTGISVRSLAGNIIRVAVDHFPIDPERTGEVRDKVVNRLALGRTGLAEQDVDTAFALVAVVVDVAHPADASEFAVAVSRGDGRRLLSAGLARRVDRRSGELVCRRVIDAD